MERINNGKLADDRRDAMQALEAAVAENRTAKLAFGAMGKESCMQICPGLDLCLYNTFSTVFSLRFIRIMGLFQVNAALLKTLSV